MWAKEKKREKGEKNEKKEISTDVMSAWTRDYLYILAVHWAISKCNLYLFSCFAANLEAKCIYYMWRNDLGIGTIGFLIVCPYFSINWKLALIWNSLTWATRDVMWNERVLINFSFERENNVKEMFLVLIFSLFSLFQVWTRALNSGYSVHSVQLLLLRKSPGDNSEFIAVSCSHKACACVMDIYQRWLPAIFNII